MNEDFEENQMLEISMINREYESLSKLDHPLICDLLEVFVDRCHVYLVHPFYKGGEIHDLMFR